MRLAFEFNADDASACEHRPSSELSRDELRMSCFHSTLDTFVAPIGISFQAYLKLRAPPRIFCSDIYDLSGEAEVEREESIDDFVNDGGTFLDGSVAPNVAFTHSSFRITSSFGDVRRCW